VTLRLLAIFAATFTLAGCITDSDLSRLAVYEGGIRIDAAHPPTVFVSAEAFKGHRRDAGLSSLLAGEVVRTVEEIGFRVVQRPSEAQYELSTELRGWWSPSARYALITLLTLTVYTPLDYKWILDVELIDKTGASVSSANERGAFRFETFGIVFFPATMVAYSQLVSPHWRLVASRAAGFSADYLAGELGSP